MVEFTYNARDGGGGDRNGVVVAPDRHGAAGELRRRGLLVLDLQENNAKPPHRRRRVGLLPATSVDVELGLRQLVLMTQSGLPLLQCFEALATYARRAAMARVYDDIGRHIQAGHDLTSAIGRHPRRFPVLLRELVRAGESSGSLELAFERGAAYLERRRELRGRVLQALFYPSIVLTLALLVAAYMVVAVVPELEKFLLGMNRQLPPTTRLVIAVSHWANEWLSTVMVLGGCSVLALLAIDRWPPARLLFDRLLYRVPLLARVRRLAATAMFARTLATLQANGIALVHSLELCAALMARPLARDRILMARRTVLEGGALAAGFTPSRPFLPLLVQMIALGERSGQLDHMLERTADFHEDELRTWIRRASAMVEPAITILVGCVVGFVYIAFFTAMFAIA